MLNGIEIVVRAHGIIDSKRRAHAIRKEAARLIAMKDEWNRPYLYAAKHEGAKELWLCLDKAYDWLKHNAWIPEPHQPRYMKQYLKTEASLATYKYIVKYCKELNATPLAHPHWVEWRNRNEIHREDVS